MGFALASAGTFAYCAILLPILLFFSLVLKRDERLLVDDKWAKRLFIFGLTACIVYIAIDILFAVAYLVIYAMFAGIQKESDRHPDAS